MSLNLKLEIDRQQVIRELTDVVYEGIKGLVTAGQQDLALYARGIAVDVVKAAQLEDTARRDACIAELLGQLQVLGEIQEIRAEAAAWAVVSRVVYVAAGAFLKGLSVTV